MIRERDSLSGVALLTCLYMITKQKTFSLIQGVLANVKGM